MKTTIQNMVNPFEPGRTELVHLTSGLVATENVRTDLLKANHIGEERLESFITDRLFVPEPDIFATIRKVKLKTFSSMTKKVKVSSKSGADATLKSNRNLFARMLLLAQSREIDMKEVLSFCLGPFPLSLSTEMGLLHKTPKSKLMGLLESSTVDPCVESVPEGNALIIDGMAIIQAMTKLPATFGELADQILERIVKLGIHRKSSRIDFVIDTYPESSIKDLERSSRASDGVTIITIYGTEQKLPAQWPKFLKYGPNKTCLLQFLFKCWCSSTSATLNRIVLYVCHNDQCYRLLPTSVGDAPVTVEEVPELTCDHEEADTRMLYHALNASQHANVVIRSPDTDVFILLLHLYSSIHCQLFFETGVKDRARILDISNVAHQLGEVKCNALIGFHALTGSLTYKLIIMFIICVNWDRLFKML